MKSPKIFVAEKTAAKGVGTRPVMLDVWMISEGTFFSEYLFFIPVMTCCVSSTVGYVFTVIVS